MNQQIDDIRADIVAKEKEKLQLERRIHRLRNRIEYYEKGERQKRAHRLITRGATVESILPETRTMSETDFHMLMERILSMPEAKALAESYAKEKS